MRVMILAIIIGLCLARSASAWNDKGHMVVAELAYQQLSPEERQAAVAILRQHPHWDEFLIADRPSNVADEQWAFWRAATWPDWVKHHHEQFSKPHWHYVDFPFVPSDAAPPTEHHTVNQETILTALPFCISKCQGATGQERAIYLCWVIHLVGDLHQPLHCVSLFNETFPKGDHGGNDSLYRLPPKRVIELHPFWDDLLGKATTFTSITGGAREAQAAADANRAEVAKELQASATIDSWAKESYVLAVAYAYLNGKVIPAVGGRHREPAEVPEIPIAYAETAGLVARVCVAKAGERLGLVLGQILH